MHGCTAARYGSTRGGRGIPSAMPISDTKRRYAEQLAEWLSHDMRIPVEEILGDDRGHLPTEARYLIVFHCRVQGWTWESIGEAVARDHSTVWKAYKRIETRLGIEAKLRQRLSMMPRMGDPFPLDAPRERLDRAALMERIDASLATLRSQVAELRGMA